MCTGEATAPASSEAAGISPVPAEAPAPKPTFLETPLADAISLSIFAWGAVEFSETLVFLSLHALGAVAVGLTLLGPLGVAIERGRLRRLSWPAAAMVSILAAAAHLLSLGLSRGEPVELLARGVPIIIIGALIARLGSRFDRGEAGWREAARNGPPDGATPLAERIAELRPPRWLAWLLLPLLPLALALRIACMGMILGYQLTFSRLMPPACRYEPTCSRYGFGAYLRHGVIAGSLLTAVRLIRCSPIGSGGYDPVPTTGTGVWWSLRARGEQE